MADFTTAEIEDGTGKSTALVYESIADITASDGWLDLRGHGSLAGGEEATQKAAMLRATAKVERAVRRFLRGVPLSRTQKRLWPLAGGYAANRTLLDSDAVPEPFLEGWRLACEKEHAGQLCVPDPALADVAALSVSSGDAGENAASRSISITRRGGPATDPIRADSEIWGYFAPILPP